MLTEIIMIIVGLVLGLIVIYATAPPPKIVTLYPTLDNIANTTYIDEQGQCYRYYAQQVECVNKSKNNLY